jgi:hypothetical protein
MMRCGIRYFNLYQTSLPRSISREMHDFVLAGSSSAKAGIPLLQRAIRQHFHHLPDQWAIPLEGKPILEV